MGAVDANCPVGQKVAEDAGERSAFDRRAFATRHFAGPSVCRCIIGPELEQGMYQESCWG